MSTTQIETRAEIVAELNAYSGPDIWNDLIFGIAGLDLAASDALGVELTSDVFVADGVTYRFYPQSSEWG